MLKEFVGVRSGNVEIRKRSGGAHESLDRFRALSLEAFDARWLAGLPGITGMRDHEGYYRVPTETDVNLKPIRSVARTGTETERSAMRSCVIVWIFSIQGGRCVSYVFIWPEAQRLDKNPRPKGQRN